VRAVLAPTVAEFLADWLSGRRDDLRAQTYMAYESHVRLHIVPAIGGVRLDALRPEDIDSLRARLSRVVGGTTARHVHMTLRAALGDAERRGIAFDHTVRQVAAPRRTGTVIETFTHGEVDALLTAAYGHRFEGVIALAVTFGLRRGELIGLAWGQIDLFARRLVVTGTASRALDGESVVTPPKAAAGSRSLTLPQIVIDALTRTPRTEGTDLVWPGSNGKPMAPTNFYAQCWNPIRKRAGVRPLHFHALRHTCATLALRNGTEPHVVAAILGHANITTLLSLYAHSTGPSTDAFAAAIDAREGSRLVPSDISNDIPSEGARRGNRRGTILETTYSIREKGVPAQGFEPWTLGLGVSR